MRNNNDFIEVRSQLVDLIVKNGGYRNLKKEELLLYNIVELEGIIEFDNHRAFWEKQYSYDPIFVPNKHGIYSTKNNLEGNILNELIKNNDKSLNIVLRNSTSTDDKQYNRKRKTVFDILQQFPEKYNIVRNYILKYDLHDLIELSRDQYKQNILRMIIILAEERAKWIGLQSNTRADLLKIFILPNHKMFKLRFEMRQKGIFKEIDPRRNVSTINNQAFNILLRLRDLKSINNRELIIAQTHLKNFAKNYPKIMAARLDISEVVALLCVRLVNPSIKLIHLSKSLSDEKKLIVKYYQASKRAENRSSTYQKAIKFTAENIHFIQ